MRCPDVQQKLDLFVTQELTHAVRERIEAHLESCDQCRETLARVRRFEDLLTAAPAPPVPDGFAARVVAQAKERRATTRSGRMPRVSLRSGWKRFDLSVGTVASLVAGLLIGALMGHETWRSGGRQAIVPANRPADTLAASGFEYLIEPGGDSLAQAYIGLTSVRE